MRKNLWKAVAVTIVLALGAMTMSALAADKTEKPAPRTAYTGKAAPTEMKGCSMQGAGAGDMQCCGRCCCMQGGMMGQKGGQGGCCMRGGMMGQKGGQGGCGTQGGMMGQKGGQAGCGMQGGMGMGGPMGCGMGAGGEMGMACDPAKLQDLGLTPEQQRKVADIQERVQRQSIQDEADLRIAQMDLQKLMRSDSPDRARIEAQIDRIAGLEAGMKKARLGAQLEVRSLLTPEQIKKMQAGPAGCEAKAEPAAKPARSARVGK